MLRIVQIDGTTETIYANLSQNYEAEFSSLTGKRPNHNGLYHYTRCDGSHIGYLCWDNETPVGFAVVDTTRSRLDIAEFYIVPSERREGYGRLLAHWIFRKHPGKWQVRQIAGADWAYRFWVATIDAFTSGEFTNTKEDDEEWGVVNIQQFFSKPHPGSVD